MICVCESDLELEGERDLFMFACDFEGREREAEVELRGLHLTTNVGGLDFELGLGLSCGCGCGCGCGGMTGSCIPAARATIPTPRIKSCLVKHASICAFSSVTPGPPARTSAAEVEEARYAQNAGRPTRKSDRKHSFPGVVHESLTLSSSALDLLCRVMFEIDGGVDEEGVAALCGECGKPGEEPGSIGMSRERIRMS